MFIEDCMNVISIFIINLDLNECDVDIEVVLGFNSQYMELINGII